MPLWTVVYVQAFWPLLAIVCGLCVWLGDRAARIAAATFAVAMIADRLTLSRSMFSSLETMPAVIDLLLVGTLTLLSIHYPRWWLLAMTAILGVSFLGHLARALGLMNSRLTYAILTGSGGYPVIIFLTFGLIASIQNRNMPRSHRV